ncbi:calvin cycle protein CP12-3, chloroplastic [Rhodamnia argentea]|uniref:Calvin cycle protein CP12-3, chloroplastic n=1 Tax=Rhodamnia argentea TaxID=178133 RepID=A0A8B8NXV6_9MYRT|nr:calvin cycle protein CP12-3, chloroplastic [Rhodamnia argentea]
MKLIETVAMASFASVVAIDGPARGAIPSPSSRSLRSGLSFCPRVVSLPAARGVGRGRNAAALAARAMAPAKYEGTRARERRLAEMIEEKVREAREVCEGDARSDGCKVAWDEVEEVSRAKADLRLRLEKQDPLEPFCEQNPETDECRVHED